MCEKNKWILTSQHYKVLKLIFILTFAKDYIFKKCIKWLAFLKIHFNWVSDNGIADLNVKMITDMRTYVDRYVCVYMHVCLLTFHARHNQKAHT